MRHARLKDFSLELFGGMFPYNLLNTTQCESLRVVSTGWKNKSERTFVFAWNVKLDPK